MAFYYKTVHLFSVFDEIKPDASECDSSPKKEDEGE
jgi:hypothetical protein